MNLARFEEFLSQKKRVRTFKPDVPPEEILLRLVSIAQKAHSMMNLQPTRYIIVKSPQLKDRILGASWVNNEMRSAPIFVLFAGDRNVIPSDDVESFHKESFELFFSHKPLGFGWLFKALCVPFMRLFSPLPVLPAVHKRAWLSKEISLSAMSFMLAAQSAGLATTPIDFYDEGRVRKILNLPRSFVAPFLIAVGYPQEFTMESPMLPLDDVVIQK